MPRIDPLQLLKCLSVLLSPEGGILSKDEVPRLVNLMTKFSKKLVSKCVYVLILCKTDIELVDMFMAEGGWTLIQTWLQDAMHMSNWELVKEILELLLMTPVDVERLKLNNIPKLVKNLSRKDDIKGVQELSSKLVEHWLKIVKNPSKPDNVMAPQTEIAEENIEHINEEVQEEKIEENKFNVISVKTFYNSPNKSLENSEGNKVEIVEEVDEVADKEKEIEPSESEKKEKEKKTVEKSKSSSSSSSSRTSSSSKDKKKSSSSSGSSSSSSRDKSKDRNRDKDRKDKDKDKDKHRSNGSSKHSSSSSSRSSSSSKDRRSSKDKDRDREKEKEKDKHKEKSKQSEKDKDTLAKIKPQSIDKMAKIPKKSDEKSKENLEIKKKPTMSIEVRKNSEERPKTVKIFNSKMRSTGLEEEVKPPPPRPTKKPSVQLPTIPTKRPSPPRDVPPEKKIKMDIVDKLERPGAIKLIPPKPKPTILQESDIFMDALTAASAKKEPKKRKRRPSLNKETPLSPTRTGPGGDQNNTPSSPVTSPLGLKNIAPINFYQDTLHAESSEAEKENTEEKENEIVENKESPKTPEAQPDEVIEPKRCKIDENGLKGVLCHTKKKGPKRSIKWKADDDLVEVRYFELDETERVNVTKTFMDMAKMEMCGEREALQLVRKLPNEDIMGQQIMWKLPYIIDQTEPLAAPGFKSLEKDIQFAREKNVLQALYFDKRRIPDSPGEPDPENHQMRDPVLIPLEDPEGQENDLRNTPWPDPKGSPPHVEPPIMPPMFPMPGAPFNPNFPQMPPPAFQGMPPRFGGPVPNNFVPPNMMPNGNMMGPNMGPNMGPPPGEMMNQGPMNPNMFGPGPDFNENPNFPLPFNNPNMFPPNNFNMRGGRGGFRGRGGNNNGPWVRMNGPGNWNRGGGAHRGGRLCKNVKNHGYCRNRDNCPFIHPN